MGVEVADTDLNEKFHSGYYSTRFGHFGDRVQMAGILTPETLVRPLGATRYGRTIPQDQPILRMRKGGRTPALCAYAASSAAVIRSWGVKLFSHPVVWSEPKAAWDPQPQAA